MRFHKDMLLLYAITEEYCNRQRPLIEMVKEALEGGVTILQLREKHLSDEELMTEALEIKELCHSYGVPLIINDNVELALRCSADGVHVGIEDTPVAEIRAKAGNDFIIGDFIIGATAKTVEQATAAELAGADYIGVGAVFPSPTKQNAVRITNAQLREITSAVSIPAVAIGGITLGNISQIDCGTLSGIAVVSAVFGAKDITQAAKELKAKATALVHS